MATISPVPSTSQRKRAEQERLLEELELLCAGMQPGDLVPTHTELMRRYGASERAVLRALEELQRSGRIVRHQGRGTFIAEQNREPKVEPVLPEAIADSRTIVAILRPDHSFFDQCLDVLFHQARAADLSVACRLVSSGEEWCPTDIPAVHRPAGLLVFNAHLAPIAHRLHAQGHRVVVLGQPVLGQPMEVPYVYGDQEQGGYLAMRHLIELGHRRIAYCEIDWGHLGLRGAGHQRALKEWNSNPRGVVGLRSRLGERSAPDTSLVRTSEIPIETIRQWAETPRLAAEFFQAPDAPTALLAWNDHQALRFLRILLCAGVRVPEQVSLIGYDALPESRLFYPSLTTLSTQVEQQIQIAVNLLTRPKPVPATHSVVLVPSLVPGESTARI